MIITTSSRVTESLEKEAQAIAQKQSLYYIERKKRSIETLKREYGDLLLLTQEGLSVEYQDGTRFSFHPDTAMLRIKAPRDPLLELVGEKPQMVLDTTMGLASDSIVLSYGGHKVLALESQSLIHLVVARGLATFSTGNGPVDQAMRAIKTRCAESLDYLRAAADKSVDVIYCDPMFSEEIVESTNLSGLKHLANYDRFSKEFLGEAKRVARHKIIIKAHFRDIIFEEFGFERRVRPYQKFHYGVIEV